MLIEFDESLLNGLTWRNLGPYKAGAWAVAVAVPETPGLGFPDLDREACEPFLAPRDPEWFAPTPGWDGERAHDRLWS